MKLKDLFIVFKFALLIKILSATYSLDLPGRDALKLYWNQEEAKETFGDYTLTMNFCSQNKDSRHMLLGFGRDDNPQNAYYYLFSRQKRIVQELYFDRENNNEMKIISGEMYANPIRNEHGEFCYSFSRRALSCQQPFGINLLDDTTRVFGKILTKRSDLLKLTSSLQMNRVQLVKHTQFNKNFESELDQNPIHSFDLTLDNVKIPNAKTTYWCKTVRLPESDSETYIGKFKPIITNPGLVHHMEVFLCIPDDDGRIHAGEYNAPCNSEGKPEVIKSCRSVIAAWAMGSNGLKLPENTGIRIPKEEKFRYAVIEVHFNNPDRLTGRMDSSGFHFEVIPGNQAKNINEVGILELGMNYEPNSSIPPGMEEFPLTGICPSLCTMAFQHPINVFASQLHTHLHGVSVETVILNRDNTLKKILNRDMQYSTHYQEIRNLNPIVTVEPGESLLTRCKYNTLNESQTVFQGISISNEMCLNYIFYYPKMDIELCKSQVARETLENFFARTFNVHGSNVYELYSNVAWTPRKGEILKKFFDNTIHELSCNKSNGYRHENTPNYSTSIPFPNYLDKNLIAREIKCMKDL